MICLWSGVPWKCVADHEMIMRKVVDQPKATKEELVNDLKTAWATLTKNTIGNTLCYKGPKS